MNATVLVNDKIRVRVKFVDSNQQTGQQVPVSPVVVNLTIKDQNGQTVVNTTPVSVNSSEYYYDFTPTSAGTYTIIYTGNMADGSFITVNQTIYVNTPTTEYEPIVTLKSEEIIYFCSDINPLYIDPEELLPYFPDASLMEISEIAHHYSLEVKQIYSISDGTTNPQLPFNVYEYIKAATACELSKTYGYGNDDELSVKLGDLSVTNRSIPRSSVNRGNATTWCQMAAVLRREMLASKTSMKGVQPKNLPSFGTKTSGKTIDPETGLVVYLTERELYGPGSKIPPSDDPMPKRGLRSHD